MARQRTLLSACYPGSSNQKHSDVAKIISQRTVESAKPPKEGRATRADGIVPGMQFITHAGGKKSFRLLARIHGKQVNLEIGDAAILSLADARAKAKGLLGAIAHGEDPREAKRAAVKTAAKTVEVVADGIHRALRQGPQQAADLGGDRAADRRQYHQDLGQASDHQYRPARRHRSPRCGHRSRLAGRRQPGARGGAQDVQLGD